MNLLTIDTSTSISSAALTDGEQLVGEFSITSGKGSVGRLMPSIVSMVQDAGFSFADIDGFGVTVGPGAFTGLRVGIATVKGLAMGYGKPVVGISSLAMLAMNIAWGALPVCTMFDARKKEVYAAIYEVGDETAVVMADAVLPPEKLLETIAEPTMFIGDGALVYRELIIEKLGEHAHFAPPHLNAPRAAVGAELVRRRFAAGLAVSPALLNPVYLRLSEAELTKKRQ